MSDNNKSNGKSLIFLGAIFSFSVVVFWLKKAFGIEWQTALETGGNLFAWGFLVGTVIFLGMKLEIGLILWASPLVIALLIPVFKPALKEITVFRNDNDEIIDELTLWYGTDWGMSLLFFSVLAVGYILIYLCHRND
ncbi:hypothetical protein [Mixta intestinalis]|jgi:hypothetical protein|uniref:Uncharacterized protein n=1 Tax=Mixta intestinalis TaxID=1615494 RepID=A0A6P1PXX6_9GAMM|nr:hypothetical protein [Mixta intestinalis]QHM70962.1 hypothetical protein C7M51_01244 [Mixta intestinalis]